ncbi:MAG: hypothetical protein JNL29_12390 [Nitrospira sp.]|nr:hypothetical protein [Nitrospira sp.]
MVDMSDDTFRTSRFMQDDRVLLNRIGLRLPLPPHHYYESSSVTPEASEFGNELRHTFG